MPCTNDPCIQQITYVRAILNGLIDGQSDDALGAALSEVLMFIRQQETENERLRRALAFLTDSVNHSPSNQALMCYLKQADHIAKGQQPIFITSDGYTLYYQSLSQLSARDWRQAEDDFCIPNGSRDDCDLGPNEPATGGWVDELIPELQDGFWYGDMLGPWDNDTKERLEGKLES
jgi:hypothetical protein